MTRGALTAAAVLVLAAGATPAVAAGGWTQPGGGPTHTSALKHAQLTAADATHLTVAWTDALASNPSGAVVGHGLVFFETPSFVRAVSLADGSTRWTVARSGTPVTPIVHGTTVYAQDSLGILALDSKTGSIRTTAPLSSVTALTATRGGLFASTGGGAVVSLDPATLAVRWQTQVGPGGGTRGAPSVAHGLVVVTAGSLGDATIAALDETTGAVRWHDDHQHLALDTVALDGKLALAPSFSSFPEPEGVVAYRSASGAVAWGPFGIDTFAVQTAAVESGRAIVAGAAGTVARSEATGALLWSGAGANTTPIVGGGLVWLESGIGKIDVLRADTGAVAATLPGNVFASFPLAISGRSVVATGNDVGGQWIVRAYAVPGP